MLGYVPISSSAPWPLGAAYIPNLLSEVEQEQRPSGNGDREAIVVGGGLCDGEGERAYTGYAPHIIRNVSAKYFSLRLFGIFFCRNFRRHDFAETSGIRPDTPHKPVKTIPGFLMYSLDFLNTNEAKNRGSDKYILLKE